MRRDKLEIINELTTYNKELVKKYIEQIKIVSRYRKVCTEKFLLNEIMNDLISKDNIESAISFFYCVDNFYFSPMVSLSVIQDRIRDIMLNAAWRKMYIRNMSLQRVLKTLLRDKKSKSDREYKNAYICSTTYDRGLIIFLKTEKEKIESDIWDEVLDDIISVPLPLNILNEIQNSDALKYEEYRCLWRELE